MSAFEYVAKFVLILLRFLLVYAIPLFNTLKLQSSPDEPNSDKNRRMLIYWIIVVVLYLVHSLLFFVNK